ncbi:GEVED domain-containing protein [Aestuariibacter sp. AA17]|uniref:GEVED domain-containing protein n=1 Tax=Fluctibacter corallii TaxID=2984329 RepID=A0ABT3AAI8_9ALTE|nr:GEVED domain-containing protein [Aestuariibacter sp. AA17]MCV2885689.1 GEVED domain-containing protein [Aestuariibacter sp. AA17]
MKMKNTLFTLSALWVVGAQSAVATTIFESKDILTPQQALGRYQWLQTCYPSLLIELADQILDPTIPRSGEQKQEELKQVLLYKNNQLKSDAKYITFGDENGQNPQRWYAGKSPTDSCVSIPSDYAVSALMIASELPQYCAVASREKGYEFIKSVTVSDLANESGATFYSNYVGKAAKVYKDRSYQLALTPGFVNNEKYPETWHVFVDWNRDGDFSDTDETHFAGVSDSTVNYQLTPPAGTQPGLTKMRITMDYLGGSNDACKEIDSGEVEDYMFYIK